MDQYCKSSVAEADSDVYFKMAFASFAAVSGKVFTARRMDPGPERLNSAKKISEKIYGFKSLVKSLESKHVLDDQKECLDSLLNAALVFHVEGLLFLKEWDQLLAEIEAIAQPLFSISASELYQRKLLCQDVSRSSRLSKPFLIYFGRRRIVPPTFFMPH